VGPARATGLERQGVTHQPSAEQLAALDALRPGPLVLFYEFSAPDTAATLRALAALAREYRGTLRWAAREEEILAGRLAQFQQAARLHFPSPAAAGAFVTATGHAAAVDRCTALQVAVLGEQPRAVAFISGLMAKLLPLWPFDNAVEDGEEPGVDVSTVMPTSRAIAALRAHPEQSVPVVMINWLKFRPQARYPAGAPPTSGRTAYLRYGKVAMTTTHSIGAKLLFAARYRSILIGNDGAPAPGLWDEFALMQYPGRGAFGYMAALRRYRRGLADREAGLAEYGQGLAVSRPAPEFTWRRSLFR
jgi:hypothetical protein